MNAEPPSAPSVPGLVAGIASLRGERADGIKHPAIALARSLKSAAGRVGAGLYIIHGPVLLLRALKAGVRVVLALHTPRLLVGAEGTAVEAVLRQYDVPHVVVSEGMLRTIVDRAYVPDVVALVPRLVIDPSALHVGAESFFLLANDLTNPSNLGMLVRTAYGAGANALLLTAGTTDPYVWQVSTGSTGAIFHLPFVAPVAPVDLAGWQGRGLRTVAAVADAELEYTEIDYRGPLCIVVGNEAHGLTADIAARADITVRIPMAHHLDSLNVAVAAGVVLFEARRQRRGPGAGGQGPGRMEGG